MANQIKVGKPIICYVGDDLSYFDTIKQRIANNYNSLEFSYVNLYEKDPKKYQKIFLKIFDLNPKVLYIDFAVNFEGHTRLTKLIKRENKLRNIPIVGLIDDKENIVQSHWTGADFVHIKCGEYHDVVYDAMLVAFPKSVKPHGFANAKFQKDFELIEDFRINYYTPTYLKAEGNLNLGKGQMLEVETAFERKIMPSKKFVVADVFESDLYYDYKYAYHLNYTFVEEPVLDPNATTDEEIGRAQVEYKERMNEYKSMLPVTQKKVKEWVLYNIPQSAEKKTKILIVDPELSIFRDESSKIDYTEYSIRCQTELSEEMVEIEKLRPNLVVFQFANAYNEAWATPKEPENTDDNESLAEKEKKQKELDAKRDKAPNSLQQLTNIIKRIKSISNYTPFVLIFNSKRFSSASFQESASYPFILANTAELDFKTIMNMAKLFEEKQSAKLKEAIKKKIDSLKKQDPKKYRTLSEADFNEKRYIVRKNNNYSHGSTKHLITMLSMTESDLTFATTAQLEKGRIYRLKHPVEMAVTLVDFDKPNVTAPEKGQVLYKGLIHSADEIDKKKIRQFVNEIFFTDVNAKHAQEAEAFKAVNEAGKAAKEKLKVAEPAAPSGDKKPPTGE